MLNKDAHCALPSGAVGGDSVALTSGRTPISLLRGERAGLGPDGSLFSTAAGGRSGGTTGMVVDGGQV